jgi:hypothetical protein
MMRFAYQMNAEEEQTTLTRDAVETAESGRLRPQALVPFWDIKAAATSRSLRNIGPKCHSPYQTDDQCICYEMRD